MKSLDVLIVVDALGATSSGSLSNNVYLIDTNKYLGSWAEGQCELHSVCSNGEYIKWRVVPVSPDNDVEIVRFTGTMVSTKVCIPQKEGMGTDIFWEGEVQTQGATGSYQYSVVLSIDGHEMTFDPFLEVK